MASVSTRADFMKSESVVDADDVAKVKYFAVASSSHTDIYMYYYLPSSKTLTKYMSIQTSNTSGVKFLIQSLHTQLVTVDNEKNVRFYDFQFRDESKSLASEVEIGYYNTSSRHPHQLVNC